MSVFLNQMLTYEAFIVHTLLPLSVNAVSVRLTRKKLKHDVESHGTYLKIKKTLNL